MSLPTSQQISLAGVQVWDISLSENIAKFGPSTATRVVECAWNDRIQLIKNLNGGSGIGAGGVYYYNPGAAYPYGGMFFSAARVEGVATGGAGLLQDTTIASAASAPVAYDRARVTIEYKTLPYTEGATTGIFSVDYGVEEVLLPNILDAGSNPVTNWVWADDNTPIDNENIPTLRMVMTDITWTQYNLSSIPNTLIQQLAGCVNSRTFWGAKPGTTMFVGAKSTRRVSAFGADQYDLTEKFPNIPAGWNNKFRGDYGTVPGANPQSIFDFFRPIVTKQAIGGGPFAGGANPYPWADLNALLTNALPATVQVYPVNPGS
jgi:hypothetical protein